MTAWGRLREMEGRRATVIDLYRLVAKPRGLEPEELPLEERLALGRLALPVIWPGFEMTAGSERRDPIAVVEYDTAWPEKFAGWRSRIVKELGPAAHRVEHIGSTAVPGLAAKPIIDIQVSVPDLAAEESYAPGLERAGVQLRSRDELHLYFRPFPGEPRDAHVHVCLSGSEWEREHLLFRDYLRRHPAWRDAYADAKREAARAWGDDRLAYTDAKNHIILDILDDAGRRDEL